jgi:hypothetical protein
MIVQLYCVPSRGNNLGGAMADQGFPLPGSSYKELIKIIQGYAQVGSEAVPSDVAKVIAVHETIVSGNNRFLVAIGVVQGGKKKTITSVGRDLALALQHGMEDQINIKWRTIVDSTDFLQKIVAAVRIRKGMDESSLQTHVAYSAGQPKTPRVLTGASTVVEILKIAGLLKEDGGNLIATAAEITRPDADVAEPISISPSDNMGPSLATPTPVPRRPLPSGAGGIHLNFEVRIQCTPQDLDGLGEKLRKLLAEFNKAETEKSPNSVPNPAHDKDAN